MNFKEQLERMCKMHNLISKQATGTPDEFAAKIGVCRRQLFNLLDIIRQEFPLEYSHMSGYYYIDNNNISLIEFVARIIGLQSLLHSEKKYINGGSYLLQDIIFSDNPLQKYLNMLN